VHKFSPAGKLLMSWGESGTEPGQFNIAHNIATDDDGWVYVADRENHACRCSTATASTRRSGTTCTARAGLYCCRGKTPTFVIGELGPGMRVNLKAPNLGPRPLHRRRQGQADRPLGGKEGAGLEPGKFIAPHGLALDSKGDIYVGEVSYTNWTTSFPDKPMPSSIRPCRSRRR
jgi:hypothetical protein